jgi:hypothetical protein
MIAPLLFMGLMLWVGTAGTLKMKGLDRPASWLLVTGGVFIPAFAFALWFYL